MNEEVDFESCMTDSWERLSENPELDTYKSHGCPSPLGLDQQVAYEGSPETWNNGASVCDLSQPLYINPKVLLLGGAGEVIPAQVVPVLSVAGLSLADGSQVAIEAP